ncbi:hypothetical protein [Rubinisphaera italica]|uniref:Uncharacterized protein n=1 Tax=Rubinisphaera italica TaxID=2527969 RepID=A0A5C5XC79_9PLAN|nr:hypothetical protein [Rubinisphaera italica]TWT59775.1 hypothetical protein Pan54_04850 [Rubinisphaera italica]
MATANRSNVSTTYRYIIFGAIALVSNIARSDEPINRLDLKLDLTKPLSGISLDTSSRNLAVPEDRYEVYIEQRIECPREIFCTCYEWKASRLRHRPLYFEDVSLERYGWANGPALQPLVSGMRFCVDAFTLPYQMGIDHPQEMKTTLGYARPGSPVGPVRKRLPWSWKGATYQTAAMIGGAALFH